MLKMKDAVLVCSISPTNGDKFVQSLLFVFMCEDNADEK